jgi:hypothetical protein
VVTLARAWPQTLPPGRLSDTRDSALN